MSIVAIINPVSGAGADPAVAARRVALLRAEASRRGAVVDIHLTERAGHARELAQAAASAGTSLVIAWGGDGTINEIGCGLLRSDTALAIVPAGSGNGLAAALGVPRDAGGAVAVAFDGRERRIDAGLMAGRPFFNIAGVGFDARVARLFNQRAPGSRGGWPYVVIGVREGCRYRAQWYVVEVDGERRVLPALLVSFANGREYGIGARIAPSAELDDGLLDATIVGDCSVLARFWHARHLAYGTPHLSPIVVVRKVKRATIESDGAIELHVDGEPASARGRVEVELLPAALTVRVPGSPVRPSSGRMHAR
jgi:YegS/Rv2252/BmrU family lipid kinase